MQCGECRAPEIICVSVVAVGASHCGDRAHFDSFCVAGVLDLVDGARLHVVCGSHLAADGKGLFLADGGATGLGQVRESHSVCSVKLEVKAKLDF